MSGHLSGKFRGSLAAVSAIAGIAAGVLGNLLTDHWLWGTFCGLLVLTAFIAVAEAFKARREDGGERSPSVNSAATGLPYKTFSYTDDIRSYGHNASFGTVTVAGGNIDDHRKTVYRNHFRTIKVGGGWLLVALVALVIVTGGTLHMARDPSGSTPQSPVVLAAEGGHSSPAAAVKGFFGNALQNNWTVACTYEPPSEQSACASSVLGTPPESGFLAVGNAIIEGRRALVPITGRACRFGECRTFQGNGLPPGDTFQIAYADALDPPDPTANLVPCQEVGNEWYLDGLNP